MEIRYIKNLTAEDRVFDEENSAYYLVGDVIRFVYSNGASIDKVITEEGVIAPNPLEEEVEEATLVIEAKRWRNQELKNTDTLSLLIDHPNNANILLYRQQLRDWPTTSDFPNTKPTAPAELN